MNLRFGLIGLVAGTAVVLTGCVSTGNKSISKENSRTLATKLHKGMPQADVLELFGEPNASSANSDGSEVWEYTFTKGSPKLVNFIPYLNLVAGGVDTKTTFLHVNFDGSKRVIDYATGSSQNEMRTGILQ